ncbi:MAG: YdeI/OmpD-associated family protein [Ginsengibacter sp.]
MQDKRIDNYISKLADFAKPILNHLRNLIHSACPQVEETIKWGFPNFDYKGMMCSMAAFKHHCVFGFWKAALMKDANAFKENNVNAMGHSGKITSLADLPSDKIIISRIKEAMRLNDEGIKLPERNRSEKKPEIIIPDAFEKELAKNKNASATFNNFSPSQKREYTEWIAEAKTEETRNKRIKTAIEWMTEGKTRNWKYKKK